MIGVKKIHIIGAGFSGLTSAYFLLKHANEKSISIQIRISEASNRAGGMLESERIIGSLVESAANAILNSELLERICQDIGIEIVPSQKASKKRFIFRNGKMRRLPIGLFSFLKLALFFLKFFVAKSVLIPKPYQTIREYCREHLNLEIYTSFVEPALRGVYAGDAQKLSASLILSRIFKRKKSVRPQKHLGSVSFKEGMGEFCKRLLIYLEQNGVRIEYLAPIENISASKGTDEITVLATSFHAAKEILPENALLRSIENLPLLSVTIQLPRSLAQIGGFGCLFPNVENFHALGVLSNTEIFSLRGEKAHETWIFGGVDNPKCVDWTEGEILEKISLDRKRLKRGENRIKEENLLKVVRWPKALPHYTVELEKSLSNFSQTSHNNLFFTGNYLGALGLSNILQFNLDLAFKILSKENTP